MTSQPCSCARRCRVPARRRRLPGQGVTGGVDPTSANRWRRCRSDRRLEGRGGKPDFTPRDPGGPRCRRLHHAHLLHAPCGAVGLYVGYHDSQRQGDTIHSPLNCLPGAGWQPLEQGRITVSVRDHGTARPAPIEVNRVVIGKGLDRQLVLYWYQSHRRVVASEYWGKVYTVLDAMRYNRTDAAMVRVITPVRDGRACRCG